MRSGFITLVVIQFAVYAILALLAFVAWIMVFSSNESILEVMVGEYLAGHFVRWTAKLSYWGIFMLVSAVSSFAACWSLQKLRKEGGYFGIVSYSIGFITNILFAQNILVRGLIGALIG
jgi:hypothetical protein